MPNSSVDNFDGLPLFQFVASFQNCIRCFGSGLWLRNQTVEPCPRLVADKNHALPNAAARMLRRSTDLLREKQILIHPPTFDLARLLTNFSSKTPCDRQKIFDTFFDNSAMSYSNQLRKFHSFIEEMRKVWLLPIGSRKCDPSGYWIITELQDFKDWFDRVKSAPITQLSTIHKVAKHNFPVFAEQMELDFWNDMKAETL